MSKRRLAGLYFPNDNPDVATNKLMRWVYRCPQLMEELKKSEYRRSQKILTAAQLKLFGWYIGDPG